MNVRAMWRAMAVGIPGVGLGTMAWMVGCSSDAASGTADAGDAGDASEVPDALEDAGTVPGADAMAEDAGALDGSQDAQAESARACDLLAQDCVPPLKCTVIFQAKKAVPRCQPAAGAGGKKAFEACTLVRSGIDDCERGLLCVDSYVSPMAHASKAVCMPLCASQADCQSGGVCTRYASGLAAGTCFPSCTMFGTDCAEGTCGGAYGSFVDGGTWAEVCRAIGTGAVGDPCVHDYDCAANEECRTVAGKALCRAQCDRTHPCGGDAGPDSGIDGGTCYRYPMPNGRGRCE